MGIMQIGISWILLLLVPASSLAQNWQKPDYLPHPLRTFNAKELQRVSDLVDMQTFKSKHLAPILIERPVGSANHKKVQQFLIDTFNKLDWHVMQDQFRDKTPTKTGFVTRTFNNIVATLNPYAKRRLVLAAHYDSKLYDDFSFIGAIDSAVPCAMLVHLATILDSQLKNRTEYKDLTLQLIFFDGEEAFQEWTSTDSIYGSRHLASLFEKTSIMESNTLASLNANANSLAADVDESGKGDASQASQVSLLQAMDVMVLLDLLGSAAPTIYSTQPFTGSLHQELYQTEVDLDATGAVQKNSNKATFFQPITNVFNSQAADDHLPFRERGVPIVHAIPMPFPPAWHTAKDNANAIDYTATERLTKIFTVFVARYLHLDVPVNAA